MTYELILTENCNRNCSFCDIRKTDYVETVENIRNFYQTFDRGQRYTLVFFGGEPLLNIEGINEMMHLVENDDCDIRLITNGDFIDRFSLIYDSDRIKVQVSAYDIFKDHKKYSDMHKTLGERMNLSYVFTEDDIGKVREYKGICESIGVDYIYSLSHSERSWRNMDSETLRRKITDLACHEIMSRKHVVLDRYIKRFLELRQNGDVQERCCIDSGKMILHRGRIIRGCMLFGGMDIEKQTSGIGKCSDCYYRTICFKSCFYERISGNVPEKLCMIERTLIDRAYEFCRRI
jgi:sulfatase maturation enzyme AslB (radical SAM superfamily)